MANTLPTPFGANRVNATHSGRSSVADGITARTRSSFGGRPIQRQKKNTPLLFVKGLFTPLTPQEETGDGSQKTTTTTAKSIFSRERAIGHADATKPHGVTLAVTPTKNVAWNRTVFELTQTLASFEFGPATFNTFLSHASTLLCQNPAQHNRLDPTLASALINELSCLSSGDRETVLTNITTFQNDLLRTAQETGTLYETSSEGLIPDTQFANLVEQMLTLVLTTLQSKPQAESSD